MPIDITITKSCNDGVCQDGKCNLISDRWGITAIVKAAEGALDKIFSPPSGSCLPEPLRQKVQHNLAQGFKIECVNSRECAPAERLKDKHYPIGYACTNFTPKGGDTIRGIIWLTNWDSDEKARIIADFKSFMGPTPPSGEEAFESTLFHEILHDKGRIENHDTVSACEKACYGFTDDSKANFDKLDPKDCQLPSRDIPVYKYRGNPPVYKGDPGVFKGDAPAR